jgi:hypothetical protein
MSDELLEQIRHQLTRLANSSEQILESYYKRNVHVSLIKTEWVADLQGRLKAADSSGVIVNTAKGDVFIPHTNIALLGLGAEEQ